MATILDPREYTIGLSEAKANLGRVTAEVNRTGDPVTVLKNNKPWVVIYPASVTGAIRNPVTLAAMDEAQTMFDDSQHIYYTNVTDMLDALNQECASA
jgi:antitoxin Phd